MEYIDDQDIMNEIIFEPIVNEEEWERRKLFVGFGQNDREILQELHLFANAYADEIMDELYHRWLQMFELVRFFPDNDMLIRVKKMQKEYFISLTKGEYGRDYLMNRLHIGKVHKKIGLSPRWYIGSYAIYMELVLPKVLRAFEYHRDKQKNAIIALVKIISLDQELALVSYFGKQ